jgi:putative two-component system hydrogenase maturation factor HypX/HoxX
MPGLRLLLLAQAFNGLTQRLHVALREAGHEVSLELDIADSVTEEAVAQFQPDLLIAPFLKRRIPQSVWSRLPCLVVHPGPPGDRGPAALDWAVLSQRSNWGVTVLQATGDYDAGPVWAWRAFHLRADATKASLYRQEVTRCATEAVLEALGRFQRGAAGPLTGPDLPPPEAQAALGWQGPVPAEQRRIDWQRDDTATVLRKVRSADGHPGVADALLGQPCRLFDAHPASAAALAAAPGRPGDVVARRGPALLRRTVDGGVWIGHVRLPLSALPGGAAVEGEAAGSLKLAATRALGGAAQALPELPVPLQRADDEWDELRYREHEVAPGVQVGWLDFSFHNGAMSTRQCQRLLAALRELRQRPTAVLVLAGGEDFFSNGIHLHDIEASAFMAAGEDPPDSAADASWRNINAIDDVALDILNSTDRLTVAALRGNAGAGGCWLACAADQVWSHAGVVLNPHYKNMGNLYGSEYWTYTLPRRVGAARAAEVTRAVMQGRLPIGAQEAQGLGLVDAVLTPGQPGFEAAVLARAGALALHNAGHTLRSTLAAKQARRASDEAAKPLAAYRQEELARMHRNFYGFDPSYHVARHHFVHRKPHAWTPRHLAVHR